MSDIFSFTILGHAKKHLLDEETPKEQNLVVATHVLRKILEASETARKKGLLALEEYANEIIAGGTVADAFLGQALLLIVDGTDPEFVREILESKIAVQGMDTFEGYLFYMIMEGSLNIQAGCNPRVIEEIMYSFLPLSLVNRVSKVIREEQEELSEAYKQQLLEKWNKYQPKATENPFIGQFEENMMFYSDREIQRIQREIGVKDLGIILAYCKTEVKNRISDNLTDNVKVNIMDNMWYVSESELTPALNTVLREINRLVAYGEIRDKDVKKGDMFDGLFSEEDFIF